MDAHEFVELFKTDELKALLTAYRKKAEPLEYMDSQPRIETPNYIGPAFTGTESLRRNVMERQAALGAYLLKVLALPAVQALIDNAPPQDVMDY